MKLTSLTLALCLFPSVLCKAEQPPAASPAYVPGLGDLMTATVQPRHTKLGLAGHAGNWAYATYEVGELREALDEVAEVQPTWNDIPVGTLVKSLTKLPLDAVEAAIKEGNAEAFTQAYRKLTTACNECHARSGKREIVIQVPGDSPYSDQDFQALGK